MIKLNSLEKKFKLFCLNFNKKNKEFIKPELLIKNLSETTGYNEINNIPILFTYFLREKSDYLIKKWNSSTNELKKEIYFQYFFEFYFWIISRMSR